MFVRVKRNTYGKNIREYLQIVETIREGKRTKQRLICSLGRLDKLQAGHSVEQLVSSLSKFSKEVMVIQRQKEGALRAEWSKAWGPVLIFDRLWEECGLREIIARLADGRKHGFDTERVVFSLILNRILSPGSELATARWVEDVYGDGFQSLELQHFYRSLDFLEANKENIEKELFFRSRDLFDTHLDLVFFDTASIYFEGEGPGGLAEYGHSKDHRSDRKQIVVGVMMSREGVPLACEFWPGSTSDVKTLKKTTRILKERFRIGRVILVCDRGMMREENVREVEESELDYIFGVRMRLVKKVREKVLSCCGRYHAVADNLRVKEVILQDTRYIICHNPEEEEQDRKRREHIIRQLEEKIATQGIKGFMANRAYKKFLIVKGKEVSLDHKRIEEESRFDGKFVLTTNTSLSSEEVAVAYKSLWQIERVFRTLKNVLEVRPVYHWKPERVKAHIFVNFLALYLMVRLQKRLKEVELKPSWDEMKRDLEAVKAIKLELEGQPYLLRTELRGVAHDVFRAVGVRPPKVVQPFSALK